eukprot:m.145365 g.145365  ORF g.145365 m.145365 type:complete len:96 (+) comp15024_c2_seq3:294-581(+)
MRAKYNATFPFFAKSNVNGPCSSPDPATACSANSTLCCPLNNGVYTYLKSVLPGTIAWNFAKFLVDRTGKPVERAAPTTTPLSLESAIRKLLGLF